MWDIVEKTVTIPTYATQLTEYKKKNAKAKRLILDGIKDHAIPHVRGKGNAFEMWIALTNLYQSSNENKKMVLKGKLKSIKMSKSESVVAYLTRITSIRDELVAISESIAPWLGQPYRVFPRTGKYLLRGSLHGRIFPHGKDCGMIAYKMR